MILVVTFTQETKSVIKQLSSIALNKAEIWRRVSQDFIAITEQKLLIEHQAIAFTDKLVYDNNDQVYLNLISDQLINLSVSKIHQNGQK